jgi:hypothetical protein
MIKTRKNPERTPIALLSCSDRDGDIQWLKDLEEIAPYVSELDDFVQEREEVFSSQGYAMPYNEG